MKKGYDLGLETPIWFVRFFLLIIILVTLVSGIYVHISRDIEISEYESQLVYHKMLSCISYGEERKNLGSIDKSKLEILENCLGFKDASLKISLVNSNEEYYVNEETYKGNRELCGADLDNFPYTCYTTKEYVLIDNKIPEFLEVDILLKKYNAGEYEFSERKFEGSGDQR